MNHAEGEKVVGGVEDGEDNEDTEYNYLADHQEEEKEEFRNDRAVKISSESHPTLTHTCVCVECFVSVVH